MCLTVFYKYQCGHTEEAVYPTTIAYDCNGIAWEQMEEQTVVMDKPCPSCRFAAWKAAKEGEPCELALDESEREGARIP